MLEEQDVKEFFKKLDLNTEEKRKTILCHGKVISKLEKEPTFYVALDKVTSSEKEQ